MSFLKTSLFEILVVGAVLAICLGFLLVELDPLDKIGRANDAKVQRDIEVLAKALDRYLILHEAYPKGNDIQQILLETGEIKTRIIPPSDYKCDGKVSEYIINVERTAQISCVLRSKRFTKLGKTHWVWCSASGKAGPTQGKCP